MRGTAVLICCALLLGCGREPERQPVPGVSSTTTTAPLAAPPTPPRPPSEPPTSTVPAAAIVTPEDARRVLEEHKIDPGHVSDEIGDHMRHRFDPPAR